MKIENFMGDTTKTIFRCKRLLSCMQLGIVINYDSGHRYVYFLETFDNGLIDKISYFNNKNPKESICIDSPEKIYGTLDDALDFIDHILIRIYHESLLEYFEKYGDWDFGTMYENYDEKFKDFERQLKPRSW